MALTKKAKDKCSVMFFWEMVHPKEPFLPLPLLFLREDALQKKNFFGLSLGLLLLWKTIQERSSTGKISFPGETLGKTKNAGGTHFKRIPKRNERPSYVHLGKRFLESSSHRYRFFISISSPTKKNETLKRETEEHFSVLDLTFSPRLDNILGQCSSSSP